MLKDNANGSFPLLDRRQSGGHQVQPWYASAAPRPAEILLHAPRHSGFVPRAKRTLISGDGTSPAPHGVILHWTDGVKNEQRRLKLTVGPSAKVTGRSGHHACLCFLHLVITIQRLVEKSWTGEVETRHFEPLWRGKKDMQAAQSKLHLQLCSSILNADTLEHTIFPSCQLQPGGGQLV
jgi:hypothetical protein